MRTIVLTQGKETVVDDGDYELLNRQKWYAFDNHGRGWYAVRNATKGQIDQRTKLIRMHQVIMGAVPGLQIDHINGDGLDNRRENLRFCTRCLNRLNQRHQTKGRGDDLPVGVSRGRTKQDGTPRFLVFCHLADRPQPYIGGFSAVAKAEEAYVEAKGLAIIRESAKIAQIIAAARV